jgi:histidyl-tRNA synthetase
VAVIPVAEAQEAEALALAQRLRAAGVVTEVAYKGNLKRRMERANKQHARVALILGEDEAKQGVVQFRDLDGGSQETLSRDEAVRRLTA